MTDPAATIPRSQPDSQADVSAASPGEPPRPAAGRRWSRSGPVVAARLATAGGAGLLLSLAFPGTDLWPAAPLAVAGLTLAARGATAGRAGLLGLVFGLAFFGVHLHWSGIYVGAVPWLALATVEALYLVPMAALLPLAWRLGPAMPVAVGGLWVAQEAVRGRAPFGGFPWGRLAFSQADAPTLGLAALGGAPLVTWAVATVGALVAMVFLRGAGASGPAGEPRPGAASRSWRRPATGAAAVLTLGVGLLVPTPTDATRRAQVSAVQGDVPEPGLEFNAERRAVLDNHARGTAQLAAAVRDGQVPRPDLVLWPENASDIDPLRNPDAAAVIDAAAAEVGVPILVGAVLTDDQGTLRNAGIVWSPTGGPGEMYIKQHPVPFGEYIPFRSFFRRFSDKVDLVAADFVAGDRTGVLRVGPATVGDVICFEVAYDGLVRQTVREGADLLVVQTNNATFGYTDESVQQLAMSRVRAVETGRAVAHISTVGVSAIIGPDGKVTRRSGHFTPDVLSAAVPLRTGRTAAVRLGVLPEAFLVGAGLLALAVGAVLGRPGRRDGRRKA